MLHMNTATMSRIDSSSSEDTFGLGVKLGKKCKGREVFVLSSDLGGGKTTFTKGLAKGLGSTDTVSSPTFTVSQVYKCRDNLYLHHFDFYRLHEAGVVSHELTEVLDDPNAIIVIEWGDIVSDVLPQEHITVSFERVAEDEEKRQIIISTTPDTAYLLKGLKH